VWLAKRANAGYARVATTSKSPLVSMATPLSSLLPDTNGCLTFQRLRLAAVFAQPLEKPRMKSSCVCVLNCSDFRGSDRPIAPLPPNQFARATVLRSVKSLPSARPMSCCISSAANASPWPRLLAHSTRSFAMPRVPPAESAPWQWASSLLWYQLAPKAVQAFVAALLQVTNTASVQGCLSPESTKNPPLCAECRSHELPGIFVSAADDGLTAERGTTRPWAAVQLGGRMDGIEGRFRKPLTTVRGA
jgi:hypothetical protein